MKPAIDRPTQTRTTLLTMGAVVLMSFALHLVPQALRTVIDPAASMLLLMILDLMLIAALARSGRALRASALIAGVLALTVALRQHAFAALPSITINLLLATGFGATLRRGGTPLLRRIAGAAFPHDMSPIFDRYLRGLTLVWVVFFVLMAATSLLLALFAPFSTWSLFVNVLTWPLTAAVFIVEWALRRSFLRHLPAHTPLQVLGSVFSYRGPLRPGSDTAMPTGASAPTRAASD